MKEHFLMESPLGTANARNPISVVVPCHRLVGSCGSLTGHAGGLARASSSYGSGTLDRVKTDLTNGRLGTFT
jgi:6-O-methylguanine DNA methyltransferase, DNA binding domain